MNHETIKKEAKKWTEAGIITDDQQQQIVERYPKKDRQFLLLSFAGLFIGLGFLTFIASNWSAIGQLGKLTIIIFFMLAFYGIGEGIYRKKSQSVGITFMIIGLIIFGSGLFLTGQMYNYMYFHATQFMIWSIAGLLLFMVYQHVALYVVAIVITTVGQIYSAFVYQEFHLILMLVLLLGFGHFTYHQAKELYGWLFASSFVLQSMVLTFTGEQQYDWLIIYFLILYILGEIVGKSGLQRPLRAISLLCIFILTIVQVFILGSSYFLEHLDFSWFFFSCWIVLFVGSIIIKLWKKNRSKLIDLVLFLPLNLLLFADMLYMLCLFIFSLGYLLIGYQKEDQTTITIGTITFLVSTLIAYVHLAWAFLDKSLFFFVGGILLFILSFLLERKRRSVKRDLEGGIG